ncbi:MAG: hypothetical protein CL829_02605, partial [Crocinitomicaceae bacterium]|nr:hypothetical protein [Crocinitomicaceae bacterium]
MRTFFTALLTLSVAVLQAQFLAPGTFGPAPEGYCVSVEEVVVHEQGSALEGQTTYRVYLNCLNETDYLGGCAGDSNNPLIIESTSGEWYNTAANSSWNAGGISEFVIGLFPDVVYDSYLTIGAEDGETTAAGMSTIWGDIDASEEFSGGDAGQNVTVNDVTGGAWYEPFEGVEANQTGLAGEDLKILFAQITTAGTLSGQVYFSVYANGDQDQEWRDVLAFDSCPIPGCTDDAACNYDEDATEDDGSCAQLDCDGVCGGDAVLDACDICNGPGAVYECGCSDIPAGDCDCEGNVLDECGVCGGDGIADGACDCDGNVLDECGVCGGDGIADGACDCDGNVLDECGVCGGEGIAEGACDCDGNVLDECGVCGGDGIGEGA